LPVACSSCSCEARSPPQPRIFRLVALDAFENELPTFLIANAECSRLAPERGAMALCHSNRLVLRDSGERDDPADLVARYFWSGAGIQCGRQSAGKANWHKITTHEITRNK